MAAATGGSRTAGPGRTAVAMPANRNRRGMAGGIAVPAWRASGGCADEHRISLGNDAVETIVRDGTAAIGQSGNRNDDNWQQGGTRLSVRRSTVGVDTA